MDLLQSYGATEQSESESDETENVAPHPKAKVSAVELDAKDFERKHQLHNRLTSRAAAPPRKRPRVSRGADETESKSEQAGKEVEEDTSSEQKESKEKGKQPFVPHSIFHLSQTSDYQQRSWTQPQSNARTFTQLETYTAYCPKRVIHSFHAHSQGVSVVRFAPLYGQYVISAGGDGCAKIWKDSRLARTFIAHEKLIRAIDLDSKGRLLTAGFDHSVKLWDIEYGRLLSSFSTGLPRCIHFVPRHEHEFLVGCTDGKVLQLDIRDARKVVQQYDQHMGGVNDLAFIEDDRRFVTSAEDRVLRVWEYGIPVVIKYVSEAGMQALPVVQLHPNRKWLAAQSLDNRVVVYSAKNRFKLNANKTFSGHLTAGYSCGLSFSPDGRFLASGDGSGRMFVWDWKTSRTLRTLQAHKGVCASVAWHPTQSSFVASGGSDGIVKLWD